MNRLDQIVPHILEGKCILFLGAGISNIAGCGDWNFMVSKMLQHPLIEQKLKVKAGYEIIKKSRLSNEEWIGFCQEELTRNGKKEDFWGAVREALYEDSKKFENDYLPLVRKIKQIKPSPKIITTNIDSCLEKAKIVKLNKIFHKPEQFTTKNVEGDETAVFHIHGYIEELESSLLTKEKYLKRYNENRFKQFLKRIFSEYSVFFLGYSLKDSALRDIIQQTRNNRKHLALVAQEDDFEPYDIQGFQELYGVEVVIYGARDDFTNLFAGWIDKNFGGTGITREAIDDKKS